MILDIWQQCKGGPHLFCKIQEAPWRMVETAKQIASRKLVDTPIEHAVLESLMANSIAVGTHTSALHPLLRNAFNKPPLPYASRFGNQLEPAIWYSSITLTTVMAEIAFYRFNFLRASQGKLGTVISSYSAYSVPISTEYGIQLTHSPFDKYVNFISSPTIYAPAQQLGGQMRQAGVEAFLYQSARAANQQINLAVFAPQAFKLKQPNLNSLQAWQCIANKNTVEFIRTDLMFTQSHCFDLKQFLQAGQLPLPAM